MAILPSLWAPVSPFLILAGALYDMPLALLGAAWLFSSNMAISWLVAGRWFRPPFERLVHRFGYTVPGNDKENHGHRGCLVEDNPGDPFPIAKLPAGARSHALWLVHGGFVTLEPQYRFQHRLVRRRSSKRKCDDDPLGSQRDNRSESGGAATQSPIEAKIFGS